MDCSIHGYPCNSQSRQVTVNIVAKDFGSPVVRRCAATNGHKDCNDAVAQGGIERPCSPGAGEVAGSSPASVTIFVANNQLRYSCRNSGSNHPPQRRRKGIIHQIRPSISRMSRAGDRLPSSSARMRHAGLRRISPSCRSCCAKLESMAAQRRLRVGVGRKGDQRRKTGAAFPAVPNVTRVLVAPILGPYGRNQLSIALNATHHVNLTTSTRR
jgi:hypothetical protein